MCTAENERERERENLHESEDERRMYPPITLDLHHILPPTGFSTYGLERNSWTIHLPPKCLEHDGVRSSQILGQEWLLRSYANWGRR
jgi:hypothetical protein